MVGFAAELPGVVQEIRHDDGHQALVRVNDDGLLNVEHKTGKRIFLFIGCGDFAHHGAQVEIPGMEVGLRHPRKIEQIVDQVAHRLRRPPDSRQIIFPLVVELVRVIFQKGVAESVDASQGRAQVVGNRIAERRQLPVDRFQRLIGRCKMACAVVEIVHQVEQRELAVAQIPGLQGHLLFQFLIEPAYGLGRPPPVADVGHVVHRPRVPAGLVENGVHRDFIPSARQRQFGGFAPEASAHTQERTFRDRFRRAVGDFPAAAAGHFFRRTAEKPLGRAVGAQHPVVPVQHPDRVVGGVERLLPLGVRQAQFLGGLFPVGDVVDAGKQAGFALDGDKLRGVQARQNVPRFFPEQQLALEYAAGLQDVRNDAGPVFLVDPEVQIQRRLAPDVRCVIAGNSRKSLIDFQNFSVGQARQNKRVRCGAKRAGEFFLLHPDFLTQPFIVHERQRQGKCDKQQLVGDHAERIGEAGREKIRPRPGGKKVFGDPGQAHQCVNSKNQADAAHERPRGVGRAAEAKPGALRRNDQEPQRRVEGPGADIGAKVRKIDVDQKRCRENDVVETLAAARPGKAQKGQVSQPGARQHQRLSQDDRGPVGNSAAQDDQHQRRQLKGKIDNPQERSGKPSAVLPPQQDHDGDADDVRQNIGEDDGPNV